VQSIETEIFTAFLIKLMSLGEQTSFKSIKNKNNNNSHRPKLLYDSIAFSVYITSELEIGSA